MITQKFYTNSQGQQCLFTKICELSIHTFDAENVKDCYDFIKYHPKDYFGTLMIEKIKPLEVFAVWVPFEHDNPGLINAVSINKVLIWINLAERFMIWKNENL